MSKPNCLWFRQWRIFPNHEPKLLIAIRIFVICLLMSVLFAYTGYLINQWRNPLFLHRTYWAPRPFNIPTISLEGSTELMRNATWQASARIANASNLTARIDLSSYLQWVTREDNLTALPSENIRGDSVFTGNTPISQIILKNEDWWKFGHIVANTTATTTTSNGNASLLIDGQHPLFVEIDIIATARDSIVALTNINSPDQSLRLVVRDQQSRNTPFVDATRPNQMTLQWMSAYQVQLMETRHIDSQSMETRTISVEGTPYMAPPMDGIALRIRPGNSVVTGGPLADALPSTEDRHGGYIHTSRESGLFTAASAKVKSTPDQFIVEISEDVPRLTALELIACWGGVGIILLLLYGFLLGSQRLRPWGVVQRYLLPSHMKHTGFMTNDKDVSYPTMRHTMKRAHNVNGAGPTTIDPNIIHWHAKMPKAMARLSKQLFRLHQHQNGRLCSCNTESAPPVTISSVSALPPPLQAAAGTGKRRASLQPSASPGDSCSFPVTRSSPAVSSHSEPNRWSSARDRQLYETCYHERVMNRARQQQEDEEVEGRGRCREHDHGRPSCNAKGHQPCQVLRNYPITMSETERIEEEMQLQYAVSDNYDPETNCIFYSPAGSQSNERQCNTSTMDVMSESVSRHGACNNEMDIESLQALLDSLIAEVGWVQNLRQEWQFMYHSVMDVSARMVNLENFQRRLETCYLSQNSFRRRPTSNGTRMSNDARLSLGCTATSRSYVLEPHNNMGVVSPPPPPPPHTTNSGIAAATTTATAAPTTTTSYPPVVTGTTVAAAIRDDTSGHIYL
ncbi:hypothetical protein BDF22DRAFT_742318 [Syncephalis plumigaleata]|nr:hypothetical protein BDF22DRAFT_742318 [Syncephalis plumigaleata]